MLDQALSGLLQQIRANPINWVLLAILLYLLRAILFPSPQTRSKVVAGATDSKTEINPAARHLAHPESIEFKAYTYSDLVRFNGKQEDGKIFLAVNGKVFNVTNGAKFYGPQGPYGNFAGRDASRGLAKGSFEADVIPAVDGPVDPLDDLDADERSALLDWEKLFISKYPQIGTVANFVDPVGTKKDN
ncbi:Dihydrodipicolinate synthase [Dimargaris verticillata]|uniref:Dihydrodipicolinate synthase n=1 Tax=Dimargaris verticillata TaxID=2761393 RepID=A0A9W8EDX5_9FUNG|nr:Dihydrodipicolinate synthase [Dimargaris verticillata]